IMVLPERLPAMAAGILSGSEIERQAEVLVRARGQPHEAVGGQDRALDLDVAVEAARAAQTPDQGSDLVERDLVERARAELPNPHRRRVGKADEVVVLPRDLVAAGEDDLALLREPVDRR